MTVKKGTAVAAVPKFFRSQAAFRKWLAANHATKPLLLVGFHKVATGKGELTYQQALDEALCHGWIDGVRRSRGAESYTIRFTPRKRGSHWSHVNIKRAHELIAEGKMTEAGQAAFDARDETKTISRDRSKAKLDPESIALFRKNAKAWANYEAMAPWYRRVTAWRVIEAKRPETKARRLQQLIEASARGERIGMLKGRERDRGRERERDR